jgi:CubicO group peptidase (beta-lactamase class C family)
MALFLRWLLDEGPVAELMLQPRTETDWPGYGYGLGLFTGVMESFGGDRIVHHGGENPGFESVMIGDLDTGAGVVLLTNSYCSPWPAAYYALRVLNAVLEGKDAPGEPDSTEDEVDLEQPRSEGRYEGHYRAHAPLINEYTVFRRNGRLRINVNGAYEEELVDIGGGQYSIGALPSPERVEFGPVVNDQALACTVNGGVYVRF